MFPHHPFFSLTGETYAWDVTLKTYLETMLHKGAFHAPRGGRGGGISNLDE